jgi:hypothetical protein
MKDEAAGFLTSSLILPDDRDAGNINCETLS